MYSQASNAVWTIPNALTFLRLALLPLFLWFALSERNMGLTYATGFLGFATDIADGYIARRSGKITKLGIILDPLADRLSMAAGVLVILVLELAWPPLVWTIVVRDVLLVVGGAVFLKITGREPPPVTWLGKRSSFLVSLGLGTFILAAAVGSIENPQSTIKAIAYVVTFIGAAGYIATFIDYIRAAVSTKKLRHG